MNQPHEFEGSQSPPSPAAAPATGSDTEVLDIIADVESRLERLRTVSRESELAVDSLRQRQQALDERQAEIDRRAEEIAQQEKQVESLMALADEERIRLESREAELKECQGSLDTQGEEIARQREAIQRERDSLTQEHERLQQEQQALAARRDDLQTATEALEQRRRELDEQHARQGEEHRAHLDSLNARFEQAQQEHAAQVESLRRDLEERANELTALNERMSQESKRFEETALRADSLQADLDAAAARATQLQSDLEKAQRDTQARDEQLNAAKTKLVQLGQALDTQSEHVAAGTKALEALEQREQRIAELEKQLADAQAGLSAGQEQAARIAQLEKQLADAQSAAQSASSSSSENEAEIARREEAIEELSRHIRDQQRQIESLTEKLQAASEGGASSAASGGSMNPGFVERRRARLRGIRRAMRERIRRLNRARDVLLKQAHEFKEFREERQTIVEAKRTLELAEQRMMRRWARSSTVTTLFCLTVILTILAGASWLGVSAAWPTTYTAHALIEARGRPGFPLTDQQAATWQTVHEPMLMSETVLGSVSERLRQRGYTDLGRTEQLRQFLDANLTWQSPSPGVISLSLNAVGRDEAQRILETYTIALVSTSNADRGRRTDGATTHLAEPATVDPTPVKDQRMQVAGIAFGASAGLVLFAGLPIYFRLRRSRSVFADSDELFAPLMNDARWEEISQDTGVTEHVIR